VKQQGDHVWSGHREITYAAVDRLYDDLGAPIRGLEPKEYADTLDKAQAYQDRMLGAGLIRNFKGTGRTIPYVGPGPTTHSAYLNPDAQREHFMADPYRDGVDNLRTNAEYILQQLALENLGAAVHALQDSYSGAHAWREDSVYDGDPTAPIQSLQVFTPAHVVGINDGKNTHHDEFNQPPAASGSTRAAIEATYRLLRCHELNLDTEALRGLFRPSSAGVIVNLRPGQEWAAERDRRLALERV
jgi:hypothetical protein